jgi:hypothetical protein
MRTDMAKLIGAFLQILVVRAPETQLGPHQADTARMHAWRFSDICSSFVLRRRKMFVYLNPSCPHVTQMFRHLCHRAFWDR